MAATILKAGVLCATYYAFQATTEAVREPVARFVEKIEKEGLLEVLVDMFSFLREAGGKVSGGGSLLGISREYISAHQKDQAMGASPSQRKQRPAKQRVHVPVTDLCDMCLENHRTVEALRSAAASMGMPYPGEELQPCHLCSDRALRLYYLESSMLNCTARA